MIVAFENEEGGISVTYPVGNTSVENILDNLGEKKYLVLDDGAIPSDREFRGAWRLGDNEIIFDMSVARDIKREAIRNERKPLLEALDIEAIRSLSSPSSLEAIEVKKQKLRDAPSSNEIEEASSVEALKNITLQSLVGEADVGSGQVG